MHPLYGHTYILKAFPYELASNATWFVSEVAVNSVSRPWAVVLGVIFAAIAVSLAIASYTKWGQSKPLSKCVALAVLAHVWLLMYAYGTRIIHPGYGNGAGQAQVDSDRSLAFEMMTPFSSPTESPEILEPQSEPDASESVPEWARPTFAELIDELPQPTVDPEAGTSAQFADVRLQVPPELLLPTEEPALPQKTDLEAKTVKEVLPDSEQQIASDFEVEAQQTAGIDADQPLPMKIDRQHLPLESADEPSASLVSIHREIPAIQNPDAIAPLNTSAATPEIYQLRFSPNRIQIALQNGGDESSEQAVNAALDYLARVQQRDGSWSAISGGAGRETMTLGEHRGGTGGKADTAMTGLALLAFLGAGHTHLEGNYRANVTAGLEYLIASQMHSGDLAGQRQIGNTPDVRYARMYSHGMALLALAECYAVTADDRLHKAVERGCQYTLSAQNPTSGGWRYDVRQTDDKGDLSQFGWQALAIQSCRRAGVSVPVDVITKMHGFLDRVAAGTHGGLAVYRPVRGQVPTAAMTAEALASKYLLGKPTTAAARQEATAMLLNNLPGRSEENFYYFYYATIAMFQQQGQGWQQWNAAMKPHLVTSQITRGANAGSWDPNCIWGGYGGRIYSTAMACMCLEVYYRYLPMYEQSTMR